VVAIGCDEMMMTTIDDIAMVPWSRAAAIAPIDR